MADTTTTRPSLLLHIRDCQNGTAWSQFVDIYLPLIHGYVRKHGLQDADAADLAQEVLHTVARVARNFDYDPNRGSFRGWLFSVVRNELRDHVARNRRLDQATGDTTIKAILEQQTASEDEVELWNREYEQRVFTYASQQVRRDVHDATWQAFWQTAIEGKRGNDVAADLGMSTAAVYLAKSRVMARLKEKVRQLTDE